MKIGGPLTDDRPAPFAPLRWQRNWIRRRAKRHERAISFPRRPSFCNKLAALAPPLVPTAPPFPRRRGHNKVPLNISFISCSNVSTGCSVAACGGVKGTGVTPANWIRRGAKRPENQVNPSQRLGGAAGKAQMIHIAIWTAKRRPARLNQKRLLMGRRFLIGVICEMADTGRTPWPAPTGHHCISPLQETLRK